jgi:transposase-like protein
MFVANFKSPHCLKCEETMSLRVIEPERPGFESQTFECPKCHDTKTLVTPISSAAEASIAAPTTIPSRSRDLCSRYRI